MAIRQAFLLGDNNILVKEVDIDFKWFSGLSITQKQKSIDSLHQSISKNLNISKEKILEISSKSLSDLGKKLSAFNLKLKFNARYYNLENIFQASKVFEYGGPYTDLLPKSPNEAKKDSRLRESGDLICFKLNNETWDLEPKTLFYDWLYLNALNQNQDLIKGILDYECFTDIEFNNKKSINCQARSAALFCYLYKNNMIDYALSSKENYIALIKRYSHKEVNKTDDTNLFNMDNV